MIFIKVCILYFYYVSYMANHILWYKKIKELDEVEGHNIFS